MNRRAFLSTLMGGTAMAVAGPVVKLAGPRWDGRFVNFHTDYIPNEMFMTRLDFEYLPALIQTTERVARTYFDHSGRFGS